MSMRALVLTEIGRLEVQPRPQPSPGADEVLIRVVATGICGSDIHGFAGDTGRRFPGQVMGHETSGHIEQLGTGVDAEEYPVGALVTFNPGLACGHCDACREHNEPACANFRVIGVDPSIQSSFAEYITVPARNVVRLAESLRPDLGALVEPLAVGFHAARRGGCGGGDRVVVIGGGPIGQACFLAARRLGAERIVVTEINPSRRALIDRLGGIAVDPASEGFVEQVRELLGGPADLVLDAVGSTGSLADAVKLSTKGTRVVLVGMNSPQLALNAYEWSTQERSIIGSFCYTSGDFVATAEWAGTHGELLAELVDGHVDLDGAAAAFARLASGTLDASKVLVCPKGTETS
jgi:threonine dehydrogenase-like Zn-dependent dehydrogenase